MTDAIGSTPSAAGVVIPLWATSTPVDRLLAIPVVVTDAEENPIQGACVRLHHRLSGYVVAQLLTDVNGAATFTEIPAELNSYYAIAFDPEGGVVYNAVIFDRVAAE